MNQSSSASFNVLVLSFIISILAHYIFSYIKIEHKSPKTVTSSFQNLPLEIDKVNDYIDLNNVQLPIEYVPFSASHLELSAMSTDIASAIIKAATGASDDNKIYKSVQGYYSLNLKEASLKRFLYEVRKQIEIHKYADTTQGENLVGNVTVQFEILLDGSFINTKLYNSSGTESLDNAAVSAVVAASGKVKRPKILGSTTLPMTATIKYQFGL
jgi:TonB family protein